jgi:hypothetical protein
VDDMKSPRDAPGMCSSGRVITTASDTWPLWHPFLRNDPHAICVKASGYSRDVQADLNHSRECLGGSAVRLVTIIGGSMT